MVKLKRIYEKIEKGDGFRVLVDRLWPRGMSKETARVDLWLKEIAPSNELRKWFGHELGKQEEFVRRYQQELEDKQELTRELKKLAQDHKSLTLLYSAKDREHNQAVVLAKLLVKKS